MNKKMKFDGSDYPDPDQRGDASAASSGRRVNQCRQEITHKFKGKNQQHPADRAFYGYEDLDDDREPARSKQAQECVRV
jgi:hypothetical protein